MIKALEHLPKHKQEELEIIKDCILEKIPDVRMIVLFGSYARGSYVEDAHTEGHTTHVYESDFDILVATKTKKEANDSNAHDRVEKAIQATQKVQTPLSIIYHTFSYFNHMVTQGQYFFADIRKEGIHLYHDGKHSLGKAKILEPEERQRIAQEDFNQWFESAKEFYIDFDNAFERQSYKNAAFLLHQATERFYSAVTLVFVNYRFRTHNIELLGIKAVSYDTEFAEAFPQETEEQRKAFKLLKKAYIDARYKKDYEITKEQLEYLAERVKALQDLTEKICKQKIKSFTENR